MELRVKVEVRLRVQVRARARLGKVGGVRCGCGCLGERLEVFAQSAGEEGGVRGASQHILHALETLLAHLVRVRVRVRVRLRVSTHLRPFSRTCGLRV